MKRSLYKALEVLRLRKGELMEIAYGKNYQGIDSALGQSYADHFGYYYGAKNPRKNLYYYVTNYKNYYKSIESVEFIPDIIPQKVKTAIINKAEAYKEIVKQKYVQDIEKSLIKKYDMADEIIENYKNRVAK